MAITCKVELFGGFEPWQQKKKKKKKIFLYHTTLMSTPSLHMMYMTRNDGADRTRCVCVCDQPGRAFVLGLRGHLAPLPVLVISLFPLSRAALSPLYLSLPLFSQAPIPSSPHLALSLSSAQGDAVLQALIRGPGRREEVGQKVVLETAGEQGWNIE